VTQAPWLERPLAEIAEVVAMGPFGSSIRVDTFVEEPGIPVISGQHLHGFRLDPAPGFNYVTEEHADQLRRANVFPGDVVFTHAGNIKNVAYIPENVAFNRFVVSQRQFFVRPDRHVILPEFLTYFFRGPIGQHRLLANSVQTGVPSIAQPVSYIRTVKVPVPTISEQRAIASILGALDDKVESNLRSIQIQNELLSLEFQRMLSGSDKTYVPLKDVAELTKGVSYKSVDLMPSAAALVTLKSIDRNGGYKADGLKPYVGPYKPAQLVKPGEIVVAQTDLTQGAEVVGRAVRVPGLLHIGTLVASLDLVIARPKSDISQEYLLGVLTHEHFRQHCRNRTNGTTVLHLASDAIPSYLAPIVHPKVQEPFAQFSSSVHALMDSLALENSTLIALRDTLLPELLSGRVHVGDVAI
jgi:type I restriction enzyme, S subunit